MPGWPKPGEYYVYQRTLANLAGEKNNVLVFVCFLLTYSCRVTLYVTGVRCSHSQFLKVILHL